VTENAAAELEADGIIVGHAVVPGLMPIVRQSPSTQPVLVVDRSVFLAI
jgi:hypothetical protein